MSPYVAKALCRWDDVKAPDMEMRLSAIACPYQSEEGDTGHRWMQKLEPPPAQERREPPPWQQLQGALGNPGGGCWGPEPQKGARGCAYLSLPTGERRWSVQPPGARTPCTRTRGTHTRAHRLRARTPCTRTRCTWTRGTHIRAHGCQAHTPALPLSFACGSKRKTAASEGGWCP